MSHCLLCLPPPFHQPAFRAHHPSTDSHRSLRLSRTPLPLMLPVLRTAASLQSLRAVCLAGETVPRTATPLATLLHGLPNITALDLRDTGLSSAAVAALTAALPTLRHLEALDVSDNRVRLGPLRGLARGIARCAALRALRMLRTVSIDGPTFGGGAVLARCLPALPLLTELRFGTIGYMPSTMDAHGFSDGLLALLRAMHAARDLRCVELQHLDIQVRDAHVVSGLWCVHLPTADRPGALYSCRSGQCCPTPEAVPSFKAPDHERGAHRPAHQNRPHRPVCRPIWCAGRTCAVYKVVSHCDSPGGVQLVSQEMLVCKRCLCSAWSAPPAFTPPGRRAGPGSALSCGCSSSRAPDAPVAPEHVPSVDPLGVM